MAVDRTTRDEINRLRVSRRNAIAVGGIAAGYAALGRARADTQVASAKPADEVLRDLMEGNARYVAGRPLERDFSVGRAARAESQAPHTAVLCCSDSRVAPEFVFDQGPGELFVVRIAGNFVTPDGLASLEYAVEVLGSRLIMVLGHSGCGAVSSTLKVLHDQTVLPGHIQDLVRSMKPGIMPVLIHAHALPLPEAIAANVRYQVRRLKSAPPLLSGHVARGTLKVIGGVYEIGTGRVDLV
jgi:carbonic anhydrase